MFPLFLFFPITAVLSSSCRLTPCLSRFQCFQQSWMLMLTQSAFSRPRGDTGQPRPTLHSSRLPPVHLLTHFGGCPCNRNTNSTLKSFCLKCAREKRHDASLQLAAKSLWSCSDNGWTLPCRDGCLAAWPMARQSPGWPFLPAHERIDSCCQGGRDLCGGGEREDASVMVAAAVSRAAAQL